MSAEPIRIQIVPPNLLAAAGSWPMAAQDRLSPHMIRRIRADAFCTKAGTIYVEQDDDSAFGSAATLATITLTANTSPTPMEWVKLSKRYYRLRYVNGGTAQTDKPVIWLEKDARDVQDVEVTGVNADDGTTGPAMSFVLDGDGYPVQRFVDAAPWAYDGATDTLKVTPSLPTGAATEATLGTRVAEATFTGRVGEVQATPTEYTLLRRLKDLLTGIVLAAGTNIIGYVKDAGSTQALTRAAINTASSGDNSIIVAPGAGNVLKIVHVEFANGHASSDNTVIMKTGATAINGAGYLLAAKAGYVFDGQVGHKELILGTNEAFQLNLSGATQVSGFVLYYTAAV